MIADVIPQNGRSLLTDSKPKKDDLIIGENEWINFIQHDWGNLEWHYIDTIIEPLLPLFDLLETECVAQCCGLDAFSFVRDDIITAASKLDIAALNKSINHAIDEIGQLPSDVLGSRHLNNGIDRSTMLSLLQHIRETIPNSQCA